MTTAEKLVFVQKDLRLYAAILDMLSGEIEGPERCRVALLNVRDGLERSRLALALVATADDGKTAKKPARRNRKPN